jgi:flagellar hook-basal body complex protein FliE
MQPLPIGPNGLQPLVGAGAGARAADAAQGADFKQTLEGYLNQVNDLQLQADRAVVDLASGKTDNLPQLVAAVSEADLSFRLMMGVRDKLVDAYKEIMRMQV